MAALIATLFYGLTILANSRQQQGASPGWVRAPLLAAIALHSGSLQQRLLAGNGLNLGLFQALSIMGLILGTLILLNSMRRGAINLGVWLLPVSALLLLGGAFLETGYQARPVPFGLILHVSFALLAYAMFTLTLFYAVLVRLQDRQLKHHNLTGWLNRLPPLQTMERIQHQLAWVSFVLLTIGMLVGLVSIDNFLAQQIAHKTLLTGAAWLLFAILFWGHHRYGWRAVIALRWLGAGYLLLSLGVFGSKLVLETILG